MTLILQGTDNSVSSPAVQGGTAGATTGVYYPATNQVALAANGIQALTINSLGYVQVGTAPAINRIYGSSGNPLFGLIDDVITIASTTDVTNHRLGIAFAPANRIGSGIFANNISATAGNEDSNLEFYVSQEGQVNSILATTITKDGNFQFNQNNTGIIFQNSSALTNSTLNDYEVGTFTPNLVNYGSSSTFTQKDGWYRKIGNVVFYWVRFDSGNSGTAGSQLQVVNLPFTFLSGTQGAQNGGIWSANGLAANTGGINPQGATNYANIYNGGGAVTSQTTYMSATIIGMVNF
jgi:hypothetical protein